MDAFLITGSPDLELEYSDGCGQGIFHIQSRGSNEGPYLLLRLPAADGSRRVPDPAEVSRPHRLSLYAREIDQIIVNA